MITPFLGQRQKSEVPPAERVASGGLLEGGPGTKAFSCVPKLPGWPARLKAGWPARLKAGWSFQKRLLSLGIVFQTFPWIG
jgi:hypothetical protein